MKKNIILISIILFIFIGAGIYLYNFNNKNNNSESNYNTSKLSTNTIYNNTLDESKNTEQNELDNKESENIQKTEETKKESIETEIASYSTKISAKYSSRQNNITIACSTLNDTIVKNGATFSFCNTLGKPTRNKGYQEAKVFKNGKEVYGLGGGKCQVSSTLYNAVLKVDGLKVVERHPHSGKVYYVPKGKDAAVSYGTYDFKFKNSTGNSIKIKASNTKDSVTIKLLKME